MSVFRRTREGWWMEEAGAVDVSPTHLPIFGSRGRVHHGFGFTGNGLGPAYLGGEILAGLALDRRDDLTRLPPVEPPRKFMPPEPSRWIGGSVIREALVLTDEAADAGENPGVLISAVAGLPRLLGLRFASLTREWSASGVRRDRLRHGAEIRTVGALRIVARSVER